MAEKDSKDAKDVEITKDMGITQIVMEHPETAEVFFKYGMHCLGCVAASFENLEQGALAHGIDVDAMIKDLNKAVKEADSEDSTSLE